MSQPTPKTRIRYFNVSEDDGLDAPGWYLLVDEAVYVGPTQSLVDARNLMSALLSESGSIDAVLARLDFQADALQASIRDALRQLDSGYST